MLTFLQPQPLASGSVVPLPRLPGPGWLYAFSPTLSPIALPLKLVEFDIGRYANRIGDWTATISAVEPLGDDGIPIGRLIKKGWRVTIRQEHNNPFGAANTNLLTFGIVDRREIRPDEKLVALSGSFREAPLAATEVHDKVSYPAGTAISTMVDHFAGGHIPLPSVSDATLEVDFNSGSSWANLLTIGEAARLTLRESWDGDSLEFTAVDAAPDSGWIFTNAIELAGPELYGEEL